MTNRKRSHISYLRPPATICLGLLASMAWIVSAPSTVAATTHYAYDELSRLTQVEYADGTVIAYTYDAAGNRLSEDVDTAAPSITIDVPTGAGIYATSTAMLDISGTAADDTAVAEVTWSNDRGGSGTAVGTMSWTVIGIQLQPGVNVLTVTATDTVGKTAVATLTVTLAVSTPTDTPTKPATITATPTLTATATFTSQPTATATPLPTSSATPTLPLTVTATKTASPTPTATETATPTPMPTVVLSSDIGSGDTEIAVDDISLFPDMGTIRIDQELMTYNGKESIAGDAAESLGVATGPQPGRLLNVQRGAAGTTPTTHEAGATVALVVCTGDCDVQGSVTVNQLITMVTIALGNTPVTACDAGHAIQDGQITVDEILTAVNNALNRCQ
jgi:YD repeat-containing protein